MSKLFICNTTHQRWHHSFRVPELNRPYYLRIPAGSQIEVDPSLGHDSHVAIIRQLETYGGRDASSVKGKLEKFPGLFYRFEKPVGIDEIHEGHAAVVDHAEQRAAGAATTSALANDAALRDPRTGVRMVSESEVEVTEVVRPGAKPTGKEVKMKLTVSPDGSDNVKLPRA